MDATVLTSSAKNGGIGFLHSELVLVLGDFDVFIRGDSYDREESAIWLPALGVSACMVVKDVPLDLEFDRVRLAVAAQSTTREVGLALCEPIVDERMKRWCHDDASIRYCH